MEVRDTVSTYSDETVKCERSINNSRNNNNNIAKLRCLNITTLEDLIKPTNVAGESKYVCKLCSTEFKTKPNLAMHFTTHFRHELMIINQGQVLQNI